MSGNQVGLNWIEQPTAFLDAYRARRWNVEGELDSGFHDGAPAKVVLAMPSKNELRHRWRERASQTWETFS